jgi:hypothetical protein
MEHYKDPFQIGADDAGDAARARAIHDDVGFCRLQQAYGVGAARSWVRAADVTGAW